MELAIFLTLIFAASALLGLLVSRIRVPWMFGALLLGVGLAIWNPFPEPANSLEFDYMAEVGMYFYLFVVGFELELGKIFKEGKFIVLAAITLFWQANCLKQSGMTRNPLGGNRP